MRKMLFVCAMLLCVLFALTPAALADGDGCREQAVTVIRDGEAIGELTLRFYEETPNVPCVGLGAYSLFVKQMPLSLRENADGSCALVNSVGAELICDPSAGTITVPDWPRFFDLPLPLEDAMGWKDTTLSFVRIADVQYEGEAAPVTLDLAKYGIRVHADRDDVYLPLSTVSNIMTDIATWHMLYNGENLYLTRIDLMGMSPDGFYESERFLAELQGRERPADVIQACYADLCFSFDYFFGHPGKAVLDGAVAGKGLDQALTDLGEEGLAIREGLFSPDLSTYMQAMNRLFFRYLSDGHTLFQGVLTLLGSDSLAVNPTLSDTLLTAHLEDVRSSPITVSQVMDAMLIPMQREIIWGDAPYREYGSTAILRLDSFMPDEAAWELYCRGEGELPQDDLGNVLEGLRRASENPEIKNVIFDLSCNSGGSPDVMMAILAVTTGQDTLCGFHRLTGRPMTLRFEVDTNFDGAYDERDKELRYDFNYGVLVTRHAFSCGNLFPFVVQEAGVVTIGEPSSGGSCCVQIGTDAEGFSWMMSSAQWKLTDSQGTDLEGGCAIDLPIETGITSSQEVVDVLGVEGSLPDFAAYFDDAHLDELMNAWYGNETDLPAAA